MYHGMCGGCGTFLWIKTTVYEYICARYGVKPNPGSTLMIDSPVLPEEYAYPKLENLPNDAPMGSIKKDEVWFPGLEYLFGFGNLVFGDSVHYEFEIPKNAMMRFVSENDGSPMSAVAAVMVKALNRALPKNRLPFRVETNHSRRRAIRTRLKPLKIGFFFVVVFDIPRIIKNFRLEKSQF